MRRLLAVTALVLVPLATAGVADAAVKRGHYTGTTSQDLEVDFRVTKKRKLKSVTVRAALECSDGDRFVAEDTSPPDVKFDITGNGRFAYTGRHPSGAGEFSVTGHIKGRRSRATGTIHWEARFNDQNQLDPNGTVTCEGDATFTAKRD